MSTNYPKLVRDRIPEIIQNAGKQCDIETLSDADYRQALRAKLIEEATEAAGASDDRLETEIADLYEVIDAILTAYNLDRADILATQTQKRRDRGGFSDKIQLLRVRESS